MKIKLLLLLVVAAIATLIALPGKKASKPAPTNSPEEMLLTTASPTRVHPDFRPVLIYRYRGPDKRPAFTAVGTEFIGKTGPIIATVEHLLLKKFSDELLIVRYLSPDEHKVEFGFESIAYRNFEAKLTRNLDIVLLRPGVAKKIECFSEQLPTTPTKINFYFFPNPKAGGLVIKKLKSLVNGKEYPAIGATKDPSLIMIQYQSMGGESGTGFVDEHGRLFVLSGGTNDERQITLLSGPYPKELWKNW